MVVAAVIQTSRSPTSTVGPYRKTDYLRLPSEPRCELIYGRFYGTPSPTRTHQRVAHRLGLYLTVIADRSGGEILTAPMDVVLSDHSVVQPDILYLSPTFRDTGSERVEGAPDLIVEVLSPSNSRHDRGEKLRLYAESGVIEYWLVDPVTRQVEFLVNHDGRFEVVLEVDDIYRSPILPEIELDLAALWQDIDRLEQRPGAVLRNR